MKQLIIEILTYMKEHLSDEMTIEEIAQHFGYSKYHFSREFKKLTGFSASDYLSSLKIEKAKQELLKKDHSITDSSFDVGYSSLGTFSTTFTKKTGLSPREYKEQVESLYGLTKEYEQLPPSSIHYSARQSPDTSPNQLTVSLSYPEDAQPAIIFVGLFHRPIPNHKPIIGTALTTQTSYTFTNIPDGKYYLLACAIEKTKNPLKYFVLNDCLRGRIEKPISFPEESEKQVLLTLRHPLPEDPPILINLPKLLADSVKSRNV